MRRQLNYRPDIDGLRALAILPVVFFHAGITSFSGGFVGVDIFFVISGFLIGGIILDAKQEGTFSYIEFYERRARRLLPALFTVITVSLVVGYFLLLPDDYTELFESTGYTVFFISNFFFMNTIDYFGQKAEFMPLLHTWSLAIEEQFYIIWPFIISLYLKLSNKLSFRFGIAFILLILVLSLLVTIACIQKYQAVTFYMTPFRLWELGLGTLTAIALRQWPNLIKTFSKNKFHSGLFYSVGLILCIGSIALLNPNSVFPGLNAAPVCIGTVLLLIFGESRSNPIAGIFRQYPLVFIGKVSYSWYLWHWIVLAYFRIYQGHISLSLNEAFGCIILSLLLAVTSWRYIENPLRFRATRPLIFKFSTGVGVLLIILSSVGIATNGAKYRIKVDAEYAKSREEMWRWECNQRQIKGLKNNVCVFGEDWDLADYRVVLWGDSHAQHFAPLYEYVANHKGVAVLLWEDAPFLDNQNVRRISKNHPKMSERSGNNFKKIVEWLSRPDSEVDEIILSAAWSGYGPSLYNADLPFDSDNNGPQLIELGMKSLVEQLSNNIPITILSDVPRPRKILTNCIYQTQNSLIPFRDANMCRPLNRSRIDEWHNPTTFALKEVASSHANVELIDLVERMCGDGDCPIFIEGRLLYRDGNHIRRNFSSAEKKTLVSLMGLKFRILPENVSSFEISPAN